jgi:hypothetical protein
MWAFNNLKKQQWVITVSSKFYIATYYTHWVLNALINIIGLSHDKAEFNNIIIN